MIELSPDLKELLRNVLQEHGKSVFQCIMENCTIVDELFNKKIISISEDCIKAIIELIEEKKKIVLEEAQKEELKILMKYQEAELKRFFAMLMGLKLNDAELERMTVFDILRDSLFYKNNEDENPGDLGVKI